MTKLLSCRYNMDTNQVEARFEDGTTLAIDCIVVEDEYGNTPAQRAELDWLLYNKPLEYAQMVLKGDEVHLLGCDLLGGNDEVSLVLAVLVIDDNHEFTLLEVFQRSLNAAEFEIFHFYLFFIYDSNKCSHSYSRPHAFIFPTSCTIISLADRMACRSWCSLRRKLHILQ